MVYSVYFPCDLANVVPFISKSQQAGYILGINNIFPPPVGFNKTKASITASLHLGKTRQYSSQWAAHAKTTATATTTPENNDLIGSMRKNNRAARAARTLSQFFDVVC